MNESFKKFMENLTAGRKEECPLSAYEKFGDKAKSSRRKIMREHAGNLRRAPAKLDLHGQTVAESEILVADFLRNRPGETVEIVTGRSGKLRTLFPEWANGFLAPYIVEYSLMPTGGAWRVRVRK
ncbi:MAG: Smr/MutS family protein [Alphaproteobacteria bacterium]|nr:Smr/MutS family protein [Alphaproteobacteria bacterium]MCL2889654.1 Smr/MutS family protein [Alphaproteobacteria bacterium]